MKKKLLILLILLVVPFMVVKADMGLPTTGNYDVYVTNLGGAKVYNYSDEVIYTIPYGNVITIIDESYKNGKFWGYIYEEINGEFISGNVNLDDVELVKEDFEFEEREDYEYHSEKGNLYTVIDNVDIYKGPAYKYGKLEESYEIKAGTSISYDYVSGAWAYVNYKDIQGWIKIYANDQVASMGNPTNAFLVRDVQMYTSLDLKTPIEGKIIPKYSEVTYSVSAFGYGEVIALVEYNGTRGWIYIESRSGTKNGVVGEPSAGNRLNAYKLMSESPLPVCSDFDCTNVIGYINYNDEFSFKYYYVNIEEAQGYDPNAPIGMKIYVDEENLQGWINVSDVEFLLASKVKDKVFVLDGINIYNSPTGNGAVIGTTQTNKIYNVKFNLSYNWLYIENGELSGWINREEATSIGNAIDYTIELILEEDVELYDTVIPGQKETLGKSIPKGTELKPLFRASVYNNGIYESWYYVDYYGTKGWISTDKATEITEPEEEIDLPKEDKPHIIKEENHHLNKLQVALIAVGSALTVAATTVVTIVLIRKKKNKKVPTQKVEEEKQPKSKKIVTNTEDTEEKEKNKKSDKK